MSEDALYNNMRSMHKSKRGRGGGVGGHSRGRGRGKGSRGKGRQSGGASPASRATHPEDLGESGPRGLPSRKQQGRREDRDFAFLVSQSASTSSKGVVDEGEGEGGVSGTDPAALFNTASPLDTQALADQLSTLPLASVLGLPESYRTERYSTSDNTPPRIELRVASRHTVAAGTSSATAGTESDIALDALLKLDTKTGLSSTSTAPAPSDATAQSKPLASGDAELDDWLDNL